MSLALLTPRQAFKKHNKSYVKVNPTENEIYKFKEEMVNMLDHTKPGEREEYHKTLIRDFLIKTYYSTDYFINTKGNNDLVIHTGKTSETSVGVIIEAKSPTNKNEMVKKDSLNTKAMWELIYYFLDEVITHNNLDLKHLIITNMNEWFIFDAKVFYKTFIANKELVRIFKEFGANTLYIQNKPEFYTIVAKQAVAAVESELEFSYFDIREEEAILRSKKSEEDEELIPLYKILSPQNLLKLSIPNDSNTLNEGFYKELLHIVGLEEAKEKGKKIIRRKKEGQRDDGSFIENTISKLRSSDKLSQIDNPKNFGANEEEQYFGVALELSITWINRILFLKLLEAQLLTYHKGDKNYSFLNSKTLPSFDDLNSLFLEVLAVTPSERKPRVKTKYQNVPYLNSSLFELTKLEQKCIEVSQLEDSVNIKIIRSTVLTEERSSKRKTGELPCLEYFLSFLEAYNFASVAGEKVQTDRKVLINASVLGLIFEKINGYKDGSFFTPGYVTMYMCREAIRDAVIQKFNQAKKLQCLTIEDVYNSITDKNEANSIINSLRICDPAVGSGHFLVSALNEIIFIKSYLGILLDKNGKSLRDYSIEIVDDELQITDAEGVPFSYKPNNVESRRVQETLFYEKMVIIENCLFGVDINHNSVKICRLRLWIELLKNAYYTETSRFTELETLPNIDINIKTGNSLTSKFKVDDNIRSTLKTVDWKIEDYKRAVNAYKNEKTKSNKRELDTFIEKVKKDIRTYILQKDPLVIRGENLRFELKVLTSHPQMFEFTKKESEARDKKIKKLEKAIEKNAKEINKSSNIAALSNTFEWRFEFPEILDNAGGFIGFDAVITNPPYGVAIAGDERKYLVETVGKVPDYEIYYLFINRSRQILHPYGVSSLIIPNTILFNTYASSYRLSFLEEWNISEVLDCTAFKIFSDATVNNTIVRLGKNNDSESVGYRRTCDATNFNELISEERATTTKQTLKNNNVNWGLIFKLDQETLNLTEHIKKHSKPLQFYFPDTSQGLIAYDKYQGQSKETIDNRIYHSNVKKNTKYKPWLWGEDVTRYSLKWNGKEYINYCEGIANPRDPKFFKGRRILVREITNPRIYSTLVQDEYYNDPAILIALEPQTPVVNAEALLGILNSKLASFYHFNASPKATKGSFPKILVEDINNFPIAVYSKETSKIFEKISKYVLEIMQKPSSIERVDSKIDNLVYQLYGLNRPQIDLIESLIPT